MIEESQMRNAMQAYIDAFNRKDLAGIVDLYADDAVVVDPVGAPPKKGRAEIERFYRDSLETGAELTLSAPIRTSHGNAAAMAFEVALNLPEGPAIIHVIDVMTFDPDGRFATMHAYWGPQDMQAAAG